MKFKLQNKGDGLCATCRYAVVVKGEAPNEEFHYCPRLEIALPWPVKECSEYLHRNHPTLYELELLAWVVKTDKKQKVVGFQPPKEDGVMR